MRTKYVLATGAVCLGLATLGVAQSPTVVQPPAYVALGDSLGEGVQSADASYRTQPFSYPNVIAKQMGVSFPLPLINDNPFAFIETVKGRARIDPTVAGTNLAVSGATTDSILNEVAGLPIATETDLVLQPRTGSQVQVAESLRAPFMTCWIGSGDALSTVLSFNQLDASQLTPVPVFAANYHQIAQRLTAWNNHVLFGNVPNVTDSAFLVSNDDLKLFLGQDFGLPAGNYTTIVTMLMLKLGLTDASVLLDPNYVLDANEVQTIQNTIQQYNQIINQEAAAVGMPVVDTNRLLSYVHDHGLPVGSLTLRTRYLGGVFSLDGVHPSNIGHAIAANLFIKTANSAFHMNIPQLSVAQLLGILIADPFVDFNGNLKVRGRPLAGLLETLGPFFGISGDFSEAVQQQGVNPAQGIKFMQAYFAATGQDPNRAWTRADAIAAMARVFGVEKWARK